MDPINDPVVILLETPFRRWNNIHKNDLVRKGKSTPFLSCQSLDKKGGKVFSRLFNPTWYDLYSWLCGSYYKQALFCWPCLLLGQSKSF
jgi:hypothetical protein